MKQSNFSPALALYSKILPLSVLGLIFMGALVTSNDAGLAVPDWPNIFVADVLYSETSIARWLVTLSLMFGNMLTILSIQNNDCYLDAFANVINWDDVAGRLA
ncbi:MAG: hypothetical protein R3A13_08135 [Bdellovibrionota bacterium]